MNTFSLLCFGLKYSQFYIIGVKYTDDFKEMSKKIIVERYLVILKSANDIVVIKYLLKSLLLVGEFVVER